jgi:hypothetical protein
LPWSVCYDELPWSVGRWIVLICLLNFCLELPHRTTPLVVKQATHQIKHMCGLGRIVFLLTTSNLSPDDNMGVPSWFFSLWYKIAQSSLIHNLVISMHGSHLCISLYNFHILHVSFYPCITYIQLDLIPYPMIQL